MDPTNNENQFIKRVFLFEAKCYSLFSILSCLIGPSLCDFRISLSNGMFSSVGISGSITSLRTVLESFLPHTAQQSTLLVFRLNLLYLTEIDFSKSIPFFGNHKRLIT
ncbi:hypothetical protein AMTRI_Chr07g77490 [Amborella trichopoda]